LLSPQIWSEVTLEQDGERLVPLDPLLDQTERYRCNIEIPSASGSSIKHDAYRENIEKAIEDIFQQASPPDLRPKVAQRAHDWIVKLHSRMEAAGHPEIDHTQQLRYGLDGCGPDQVKLSLRRAIESDCLQSKDLSPKIKSIWSHWYLKVDVVGYRLDGDVLLRYGIHVEIEWELPGPEKQVSKIVKRKYGGYVPYVFRCQTLYGKAAMEDSQTEPLSDPSTPSVSVSEMSSRLKDFLGGSNPTGRLANKLSEYLQPSVCQSSKASRYRDGLACMLDEVAFQCGLSHVSYDSSSQASNVGRLFRSTGNILRGQYKAMKEHEADRFGRTNRPVNTRSRWWRRSDKSAGQDKIDMQEHHFLGRNVDDESGRDHPPSSTQGSTMTHILPELDFQHPSDMTDSQSSFLCYPSGSLAFPANPTIAASDRSNSRIGIAL
jgi:hypothetical protein